MKVEIAIISIMVIAGVVLFLPQTTNLFPNPPEILDGINEDASNFQSGTKEKLSQTKDKLAQTMEKPVEKLNSGIHDLKTNLIDLTVP